MVKSQIPLIKIPLLQSNRTENNGRLLRRPQPRKLEPLRQCLSPVSSPDAEDDTASPDPDRQRVASEEYDAVEDWLYTTSREIHIPAGHTTPNGPPPTVFSHRTNLQSVPQGYASLSTGYKGRKEDLMLSGNKHSSLVKSRDMPTASAKVLLRTTIHTGPQGLPPPQPRKPRNIIPFEAMTEKGPSEQAHLNSLYVGAEAENDPSLKVNEFITRVAVNMSIPQERVETTMFSRANFHQLTKLIHEKLSTESNRKEGKLTHSNLNAQIPSQDLPYRPSSHAVTGSRVPQTQILIQMASMLTEQIQATAEGRNIRALIRPFPKWTPDKPVDEMPRAEIILYEQSSAATEREFSAPASTQLAIKGEGQQTSGGFIMRHTSETHFMDSKRNRTPFDFSGDTGLDPTDIAVLDALVSGGAVLSLKAHFIDTIPDISPITTSLRYLNLSFNNFTNIPPEVLLLSNLEVLKLRNNPIREIPDEIRHLKLLRTFEIPFCLVSDIPNGLLSLKHLQYLDLSYNKLVSLPEQMKLLQSLQVLFVEGNQLVALPCACLALPHLRYIRVRNNFMHPIFWPDYMANRDTPLSLRDLAGLLIKQLGLDSRYGTSLPPEAKAILDSARVCHCCHGPMIGEGVTLIRPGSLYGVKNVPFMFRSCSHYCAKLFMNKKENLLELFYADSPTNEE